MNLPQKQIPSLSLSLLSKLKKRFFSRRFFPAFTLVELIVVISVLAVLATIAFSAVGNITSSARDSQRLTDMSSMKSALEMYSAKSGILPTPTNGTAIVYSGGVVWTQGTFGDSVAAQIKSISPKPADPKYALEYVYSVANNGREYEVAGILEKMVGIQNGFIQKATAATTQNIATIKGNYNGISLKVVTGSLTYVLAVPTIIAGDIGTGNILGVSLIVDGRGSLPKGFSGTVIPNANVSTGTFTPTLAWSGAKLPDTTTDIAAMVTGLQNAYATSTYSGTAQIQTLLNTTGSTALVNYGNGLLNNALGGNAVALASNTNTNTNTTATCATGYILVPGNSTFNTTDFCVMKYEAKVAGGTPNSTYNGHNYLTGEITTSTATDVPIVNVTQPQAIAACQSIGAHLITNNEWMTIARNIEATPSNWSSNSVGTGYLYSGHNDNGPASALAASTDDTQGYFGTNDSSTSPGDNVSTNFASNVEQAYKGQRRTLTLSNGNTIWDLAGNVWEHVNKANTFDTTNIDSNSIALESACSNNSWNWWSWSGDDGVAGCLFINGYSRLLYGPLGAYNANNGMGRIYATNTEDRSNIFLRGGRWNSGAHAGVFTLILTWAAGNLNYNVGFRCAR